MEKNQCLVKTNYEQNNNQLGDNCFNNINFDKKILFF